MNNFIFRVESDNQKGMGHFYRCLALANIIDNYQRTFLMSEYQPHLEEILNSYNIKLEMLDSASPSIANSDELSSYIGKKDIVVLDGYQYDEIYMEVINNIAAGLVVIDDLNQGKYYADVVINHGPHSRDFKYNSIKKTKLLLGEQYTILRPAFYKYAGMGKVRNQVKVISICFGGADLNNFALKYLEALNHMDKRFQINIIIGSSNYNPKEEYEKFNQNLVEVVIHKNVSDEKMALLLLSSDLLIATPSNIMMEACTINIPTITQAVAQNQIPFYEFLDQNKLATCIAEFSEISIISLAKLINTTIFDNSYRKKMIGNQKKIFDGKSRLRLRSELENLANKCGLKKENKRHVIA